MLLSRSAAASSPGPLRAHAGQLRFASGLLIALVALAITFNLDTSLQTALPGYTSALQGLEDTGTARHQLQQLDGERTLLQSPTTTATTPSPRRARARARLPVLAKAPPIIAGGDWFNSKPLSIAGLRGKVVLLDFWTYSCINCLRTLPHLEAWCEDLPPLRARDHRRPQPRVRLRARRLERRRRDQAARHPLPGRAGQQLRDLDELRQRVLAGRLPDRPAGPDPGVLHRRGRLRRDRVGHPAAARGLRRR